MKARTGDGALPSRYAVLFLALAALAAAVSFAASSSVHAQEGEERPGLLNRLFGSPAYRIEDPPADVGKPNAVKPNVAKPDAAKRRAERNQKKKARVLREPIDPQVTVITKRPDARVVLVIGDFLGSGLAEGLATAFTQSPIVRIVDRTAGSSGFVREDFLNWPEKVDELITSERPAAVVVMIGANDRQQMLVDGVRETVRSQNWNKEYAERAEALAKAISARNVPFLWVGMPPFKSSKTMLDMLAFNDIYRVAAASAGGEFVDIWDGFVDENGAYMPTGPDINGQPARLRANDGINLARPGKRKVAFYAEKPLYKLLGQDPTTLSAPTALAPRPAYRIMGPFGPAAQEEPSDIDVLVDPNELGPLDPGRPVALRTPALDGGVELLGVVAEPRHEARTPAEKLAIEGIAPAPVTGRADQFASPQLVSAATAMRAMTIESTLNKNAPPSVLPDPVEDTAEPRAVRSDALTAPQPEAPLPAPPAIQPDRLEEISPVQAAPAIAAAEPPTVTPATLGRAVVPNAVTSDPLDLSPARGAPYQAYKRPKSIGPEPNRAPTAVPKQMEVFTPAEVQEEIPAASNADDASEAAAEAKPGLPDTAPARSAAPSIVPEPVDDLAPARGAPRKADPVPVAALPATKDAPTELLPAAEAPKIGAPSAPVEPAADVSVAKAVPSSIEPAGTVGDAPVKSAPSTETAPNQAPVQAAPTALPAAATPSTSAQPETPPAASSPSVEEPAGSAPTAPEGAAGNSAPAPEQPATPVAPAAPTVVPDQPRGAPAKAEADDPASGPARAIQPLPSTPG